MTGKTLPGKDNIGKKDDRNREGKCEVEEGGKKEQER